MRKFQLTIKLDCFLEPGKTKTVEVYTDANNVWEVVCAGFHQLAEALRPNGFSLPFSGVVNATVKTSEWESKPILKGDE